MRRGIFIAALTASLAIAGATHAAGGGGHGAEPAEESSATKMTPSPNYVPFDPLTATVAKDRRSTGILQIDAGLEIEDARLRARALSLRPRLRDAYTAALAEYTGGAYVPGRAPDAVMIGDMLQAATDRVLGQDGADFLLGMVILH